MKRLALLSLAALTVVPLYAQVAPPTKSLFDGKTLTNWKSTPFGDEGSVTVKDGMIVLAKGDEMTGITWTGDTAALPKLNYEISLQAQRIDGNDFFCGLTFPVKDDPCSFIVGGWNGGVVGLSSLDGKDAARNETARFMEFTNKRWYKIRVRVSERGIAAWIDDKQVVGVETKGRKIGIRSEVEASRPLGIACYNTVAGIKDIQIRPLTPDEAKASIPVPPVPKPK
ncbi:3-keto-disaccharide hydrolase [Armatimonas rosea]|uniref:3-keto-alpha-glucoside-1,2-lyase/3-keto-2-hydroxy-glucal hydratase domain-containing protein n=1 Tax=Armatimonas rosea TaxID=685828 RepID=A0A7W9SP42_ARMRO|nr:DUF1080 domain-containing protein [Armatimonas rosea]MBB6049453.1 hypothetical protein [Armatimonas rosea]